MFTDAFAINDNLAWLSLRVSKTVLGLQGFVEPTVWQKYEQTECKVLPKSQEFDMGGKRNDKTLQLAVHCQRTTLAPWVFLKVK